MYPVRIYVRYIFICVIGIYILYELKKHQLRLDGGYSKLLDQRKQAKLQ
jgi:hypothetical protein